MNGLKGMSSRAGTAKMGQVVSSGSPKIHPAATPRPASFPKVPTLSKDRSFGGPGGILKVRQVEK